MWVVKKALNNGHFVHGTFVKNHSPALREVSVDGCQLWMVILCGSRQKQAVWAREFFNCFILAVQFAASIYVNLAIFGLALKEYLSALSSLSHRLVQPLTLKLLCRKFKTVFVDFLRFAGSGFVTVVCAQSEGAIELGWAGATIVIKAKWVPWDGICGVEHLMRLNYRPLNFIECINQVRFSRRIGP